jgi:hypothetical protein
LNFLICTGFGGKGGYDEGVIVVCGRMKARERWGRNVLSFRLASVMALSEELSSDRINVEI